MSKNESITRTDNELLSALKANDRSALNDIYIRYHGLLYRHCYSRFPDHEEVRDILQELFIYLWNNRESLKITSSLSSYLYASVRNRIINIYHHNKVKEAFTNSLQDFINVGVCITDERIREKELILLIEREVAALPPQMRRIFEMSRFLEMSHQHIATELNISPQTVRTQVRNALRILRVKLGTNIFSFFF